MLFRLLYISKYHLNRPTYKSFSYGKYVLENPVRIKKNRIKAIQLFLNN